MAALSTGWHLLLEVVAGRGLAHRLDGAEFEAELVARGNEQVRATTELTPGGRFIEGLRTLIGSGEARVDGVPAIDDVRATRIGFVKSGAICVMPERTVTLINSRLHADGDRLPRAEAVGRSLSDMGMLTTNSKGRCAWRTADPETGIKTSVWALKEALLVSGLGESG